MTLCYRLDLASLTSVREAAAAILKSESRLDVLINNAGTKMSPKGAKTQDGFDMQFGVNYLGHYLLTQLLMPLIKKTEEAGGRPRSVLSLLFRVTLFIIYMWGKQTVSPAPGANVHKWFKVQSQTNRMISHFPLDKKGRGDVRSRGAVFSFECNRNYNKRPAPPAWLYLDYS